MIEWWNGVVAALGSAPYWWGVISGMVLLVVLVLGWAMLWPDSSGTAPSRRQLQQEQRQRVYRAWCASHGWCPVHDVADGECPPVATTVHPGGWPALGVCPGSSGVRRTDDLAALG